ncbi:hypothetical protein ADUPG1_006792, partial [Aduncisulcus paluster]
MSTTRRIYAGTREERRESSKFHSHRRIVSRKSSSSSSSVEMSTKPLQSIEEEKQRLMNVLACMSAEEKYRKLPDDVYGLQHDNTSDTHHFEEEKSDSLSETPSLEEEHPFPKHRPQNPSIPSKYEHYPFVKKERRDREAISYKERDRPRESLNMKAETRERRIERRTKGRIEERRREEEKEEEEQKDTSAKQASHESRWADVRKRMEEWKQQRMRIKNERLERRKRESEHAKDKSISSSTPSAIHTNERGKSSSTSQKSIPYNYKEREREREKEREPHASHSQAHSTHSHSDSHQTHHPHHPPRQSFPGHPSGTKISSPYRRRQYYSHQQPSHQEHEEYEHEYSYDPNERHGVSEISHSHTDSIHNEEEIGAISAVIREPSPPRQEEGLISTGVLEATGAYISTNDSIIRTHSTKVPPARMYGMINDGILEMREGAGVVDGSQVSDYHYDLISGQISPYDIAEKRGVEREAIYGDSIKRNNEKEEEESDGVDFFATLEGTHESESESESERRRIRIAEEIRREEEEEEKKRVQARTRKTDIQEEKFFSRSKNNVRREKKKKEREIVERKSSQKTFHRFLTSPSSKQEEEGRFSDKDVSKITKKSDDIDYHQIQHSERIEKDHTVPRDSTAPRS